MAKKPQYRRILLKLSGAAMSGEHSVGFSHTMFSQIAEEIESIRELDIEVAVVIGAGNIFRGRTAKQWQIDRIDGDHIGMLGTITNSLLLQSMLNQRNRGSHARVMCAFSLHTITETYSHLKAIEYLSNGWVILLAGGIGQPFISTDYASVQRAIETQCDALLIAKQGVEGVLTADPKKNADARCYRTMNYREFITQDISIMDQGAVILAEDHELPMHIFGLNEPNTIKEICLGKQVGTYVDKTMTNVIE